MQTCHRCKGENSDLRRFCASCGATIASPCMSCGFSNEVTAKFCGGCGRNLSEMAGSTAGTASPGAAKVPETDQGMNQLLTEITAEQTSKEEAKKFFDASELEALFDDDPTAGTTPPAAGT